MHRSPDEMWDRFLRAESLSETDPSPLVRAVRDNTKGLESLRIENDKEHQSLRRQVYLFMAIAAGAIMGIIGNAAVRSGVVQ